MRDLWNLFRASGPQSQALHFSYEKAGLTIDNQPIPWNAEAVLVEANVRVPGGVVRQKDDFRLRVGASPLVLPEAVRQETGEAHGRLFFRLHVPDHSTTAELTWRDRTLGQVTLPVVSREEFVRQLSVQIPTVHARLGEQTIACSAFVSGQCQALTVTGTLSSPFGLAPLVDLDLRVEMRRDGAFTTNRVPVRLSSSQLRTRQAVVAVTPPRPRHTGSWVIDWRLDDRVLATQRVKAVSKRHFLRSLRISATRFVVHLRTGERQVMRCLPPQGTACRVGPCFLVGSSEPGIAGRAALRVVAKIETGEDAPVFADQDLLISDGPMPLYAGEVDRDDLANVKHFVLASPAGTVGILPLAPVPSATFTSEGGFRPVEDFAWSPAAEEQLNERLGRLLGGA
jgi:hypothetical protein